MKRFARFATVRAALPLAASLLVGLFAVAPAYANHNVVSASVDVVHGDTVVASYTNLSLSPFSSTVSMNNRDYGRFVRWCGATSKTVFLFGTDISRREDCLGSSTWYVGVTVQLLNCAQTSPIGNCTPTTHGSAAEIAVLAQKN